MANLSSFLPEQDVYTLFTLCIVGKIYGDRMVIVISLMRGQESSSDFAHRTALEFDPDRFLDERKRKYLLPNPFIFLPFNAGPRICLGQQVRFLFRHDGNGLLNSKLSVRVQRDVIHDGSHFASL